MYVSYTDVEIKLEPSDEEFTDCVGKLKLHLKTTKYILVLFIASSNVSIKVGQWISNFPVSSSFILRSQQLTSPTNILITK